MSPLQAPSRSRRAPLSVRLNDQEFALLQNRAGGLPLSTYLKQAGLGDAAPAIRRRQPPSPDQRILATILAAIGQSRLPNNLNQLAKAVHSGSLPVSRETEAEITQACRDVWLIRKALLLALGVKTDHEPPQLSDVFNRLRGSAS